MEEAACVPVEDDDVTMEEEPQPEVDHPVMPGWMITMMKMHVQSLNQKWKLTLMKAKENIKQQRYILGDQY